MGPLQFFINNYSSTNLCEKLKATPSLIQILDNKSCVPNMFICPNTQHFSLPHKPIQLEFHLFKILKSFLQFSELVSNRM